MRITTGQADTAQSIPAPATVPEASQPTVGAFAPAAIAAHWPKLLRGVQTSPANRVIRQAVDRRPYENGPRGRSGSPDRQ